jgi:hypothetical protein
MQWLMENKEWIFSGAGIFAISVLINLFVKSKKATKQVQKSGSNSINYQAGGDIRIGNRDDK